MAKEKEKFLLHLAYKQEWRNKYQTRKLGDVIVTPELLGSPMVLIDQRAIGADFPKESAVYGDPNKIFEKTKEVASRYLDIYPDTDYRVMINLEGWGLFWPEWNHKPVVESTDNPMFYELMAGACYRAAIDGVRAGIPGS